MDKLINWLKSYPLWGEADLPVDTLAAAPTGCGLFPQGRRVLWEKVDVIGNKKRKVQEKFLLRRQEIAGADASRWLEQLSVFLEQDPKAPAFGPEQTVRGEKGRLVRSAHTGAGLYEMEITLSYLEGDEYGEN